MQAHEWLVLCGIVVTVVIAIGAFYDRVVASRFTERDQELRRVWIQLEKLAARSESQMTTVATISADIRALVGRLDSLDTKMDKILTWKAGQHE